MDKVAALSTAERRELFSETAARRGMTPAIVEKDFWVTWTLDKLFSHPELSRVLMFKGGTSLSKVFGLIERFSEDIDLILDWNILTGEDPEAARSRTKQEVLNKAINEGAQTYIAEVLQLQVTECIDPVCRCNVDVSDPHVLNVLAKMAVSETKQAALEDQGLLESVVEFKKKFYYSGWAAYDLAKPGTLKLIPPAHVLEAVKADYRDMRAMIFGEYLEFEVIVVRLQALENEINGMAS